eukprot:4469522-Pleurochrysis_carterae.AAC.2
MYSVPASREAEGSVAVRRTSSLASASSRKCAAGTSGIRPSGCSRLQMTGGLPSEDARERKWHDTENVEHGGEAAIAAYSPAAHRCSRRW